MYRVNKLSSDCVKRLLGTFKLTGNLVRTMFENGFKVRGKYKYYVLHVL